MTRQNPFQTVLNELGGGATLTELGHEIVKLIAEIQSTGRGGSLVLSIKVTPKGANSPQLLIDHDLKVNMPKPERETTILYADENSEPSKRDPRQPKFPVMEHPRSMPQAVGGPSAVPAGVNPETGETT